MQFRIPVNYAATSASEAEALRDAVQAIFAKHGLPMQIGPIQAVDTASERLEIHTDGGCDLGRGGIGAWAWVLSRPHGETLVGCGAMQNTTNNRMEMLAVIRALDEIEIGTPVTVYSDSEYLVKGVTVWSRQWVKNGWKTRGGKQVLNRDLWQQLIDIYQLHDVKFVHVPGHSGDERNEMADQLCTQAMTDAGKLMLMGGDVPFDKPDVSA